MIYTWFFNKYTYSCIYKFYIRVYVYIKKIYTHNPIYFIRDETCVLKALLLQFFFNYIIIQLRLFYNSVRDENTKKVIILRRPKGDSVQKKSSFPKSIYTRTFFFGPYRCIYSGKGEWRDLIPTDVSSIQEFKQYETQQLSVIIVQKGDLSPFFIKKFFNDR